MTTDKTIANDPFPEMRAFWSALAEGVLTLGTCEDCGEQHFYPRMHCPFCGSERVRWATHSGKGTVYSFSIPRRSRPPVAPAIIELEGGVCVSSVIREADLFGLDIGDSVELYLRHEAGKTDLAFTTLAAQQARQYAAEAGAVASQVSGLVPAEPDALRTVAVMGAGTMGIGIAMALANAGIAVALIDVNPDSLARAKTRIAEQYEVSVQRKRLTRAQVEERLSRIGTHQEYAALADADAVIEAVWEQMALKKEVFAQIDAHARPDALLGTNTSGLDINEIAASTRNPERLIGLHFFTPAQSMKLLEVVRGRSTSDEVIARGMALGVRLGKVPVLVESRSGFVGNRIFRAREAQARAMLLEGATPEQVDRVLMEFGMPMGSFELQDMTGGVELLYRRRQAEGGEDWLGDRMFEAGRLGQKVGKGYYRYQPGSRKPLADPEMLALLEEGSRACGIARRELADEEVRDRLILPMVNEACRLIEEGVVARPSDVDAVWLHGYGWPTWRGGILYHADRLGAQHVVDGLSALQGRHGSFFEPSPLLAKVAREGGRLLELPQRSERAAQFRA